jgi:hypothetical protein
VICNFFRYLTATAIFFTFINDIPLISSFAILASLSIFLSSTARFYLMCLGHFAKNAFEDLITSLAGAVFIPVRFAASLPCSLVPITAKQSLTLSLLHGHDRLFAPELYAIGRQAEQVDRWGLFLQASSSTS